MSLCAESCTLLWQRTADMTCQTKEENNRKSLRPKVSKKQKTMRDVYALLSGIKQDGLLQDNSWNTLGTPRLRTFLNQPGVPGAASFMAACLALFPWFILQRLFRICLHQDFPRWCPPEAYIAMWPYLRCTCARADVERPFLIRHMAQGLTRLQPAALHTSSWPSQIKGHLPTPGRLWSCSMNIPSMVRSGLIKDH